MFQDVGSNAHSLNLNLGNKFNTSKVKGAYQMFMNTGRNVQTNFIRNLNSWDTSKVTEMMYMFANFPTSKATIYVKDAEAQQWVIAQNSNFSASNVLIK